MRVPEARLATPVGGDALEELGEVARDHVPQCSLIELVGRNAESRRDCTGGIEQTLIDLYRQQATSHIASLPTLDGIECATSDRPRTRSRLVMLDQGRGSHFSGRLIGHSSLPHSSSAATSPAASIARKTIGPSTK